ncbi:MAG TPA: GTP cyclohydrolase I FolE2 [Thermoplasmata archaeon]|nr:GTP cyclohydrolase I FolE2 [Thermoplasmata archaeon]
MIYPDVQSWKITSNFPLTRVGTTDFKLPFKIRRPDGLHVLIPEINVFVDLPPHLKGSHMSRNIEVIHSVRNSQEEFGSLEEICERISTEMLKRHEYAECAEVTMRADYFLDRKNPGGKMNTEQYGLIAEAVSKWEGKGRIKTTKVIGVEVTGLTACPCGMETTRAIYLNTPPAVSPRPSITHNQRNISRVCIETQGDQEIEANELIEIVEKAMSSPSFGILKRKDEAAIIWKAHNSPKFVEDVVRDILKEIVKNYPELDDESVVTVSSKSFESIHKHNAFAEAIMKMRELRKIYSQNRREES